MKASAHGSVPYRPAIDGLRAIAVLAVFFFHLQRGLLPGGFVGVDIFFVISGYLITSILLRDCETGKFSLAKFYQRRIARLFPAFLLVLLVTIGVASAVYLKQDLASSGANLTAAVLSVANMKDMLQGNYFAVSADAQPFLHYWSLSVEEQFYLFFPLGFWLLFLKARRHTFAILGVLCGLSLVSCIWLTRANPVWAFFLLPTRAWELLAGALLATASAQRGPASNSKVWNLLALAGLAMICLSLFVVKEGPTFPGYAAILPVLGTVLVLGPYKGSSGFAEWLLSRGPMVQVGRMSYSLYLWHWPVFSLVDYKFFLASPWLRLGLKVVLTFAATLLCFRLIENPGRIYLNDPRRRPIAFAFLTAALLFFVPLGMVVRKANYIDADPKIVAKGGLIFNDAGKNGKIVLMGDSDGSMFGKLAEEVALERGMRLTVISASAEDPLPVSSGPQPQLWLDSLAVVKREKPDVLVLACSWQGKLRGDQKRLPLALAELEKYSRRIILITQPPELPSNVDREALREGLRPPFMEAAAGHAERTKANEYVKSLDGGKRSVIDIEPFFATREGRILYIDAGGVQFYHDVAHLSEYGVDLVKPAFLKALEPL